MQFCFNPRDFLQWRQRDFRLYLDERNFATTITLMVLFSVTLDFVQKHRAGKAAASCAYNGPGAGRVIVLEAA